eukprot:1057380-Pelagomonas_calceolata.AAC.2
MQNNGNGHAFYLEGLLDYTYHNQQRMCHAQTVASEKMQLNADVQQIRLPGAQLEAPQQQHSELCKQLQGAKIILHTVLPGIDPQRHSKLAQTYLNQTYKKKKNHGGRGPDVSLKTKTLIMAACCQESIRPTLASPLPLSQTPFCFSKAALVGRKVLKADWHSKFALKGSLVLDCPDPGWLLRIAAFVTEMK